MFQATRLRATGMPPTAAAATTPPAAQRKRKLQLDSPVVGAETTHAWISTVSVTAGAFFFVQVAGSDKEKDDALMHALTSVCPRGSAKESDKSIRALEQDPQVNKRTVHIYTATDAMSKMYYDAALRILNKCPIKESDLKFFQNKQHKAKLQYRIETDEGSGIMCYGNLFYLHSFLINEFLANEKQPNIQYFIPTAADFAMEDIEEGLNYLCKK